MEKINKIINKIKELFKKIRGFSLLEKLLDSKISTLIGEVEFRKETIKFYQDKLVEADELKTNSLREISRLANEIKELNKRMDDILKVRCP